MIGVITEQLIACRGRPRSPDPTRGGADDARPQGSADAIWPTASWCLPGGFGTVDEFAEMLTWNQLGLIAKPVVLLDVDGYWGPLFEWMSRLGRRRLRPRLASHVGAAGAHDRRGDRPRDRPVPDVGAQVDRPRRHAAARRTSFTVQLITSAAPSIIVVVTSPSPLARTRERGAQDVVHVVGSHDDPVLAGAALRSHISGERRVVQAQRAEGAPFERSEVERAGRLLARLDDRLGKLEPVGREIVDDEAHPFLDLVPDVQLLCSGAAHGDAVGGQRVPGDGIDLEAVSIVVEFAVQGPWAVQSGGRCRDEVTPGEVWAVDVRTW